jgi:hypothetical protein
MSELGHNSGSVDPELAAEAMKRALAPWEERRAAFVTKAAGAVVEDIDSAAAAIDFVRMVDALREKARDLMTEVRSPYTEAANAAGGVGMRFIESLDQVESEMRDKLEAYNAERKRKSDEVRAAQLAEEERLRSIAATRAGVEQLPAPAPESSPPPPRRRKAAPIRTDLGGRMSEQERWRIRIDDISQIPHTVLNSDRVKEAIAKVAYDLVKNGIAVPGTSKDYYTTTSIT